MPDALTLWSLAVLVIGGLMYAAMSMSTRSAPSSSPIAMRRPGWIARRRARGGISHRRDRVGVGYKSAVGAVHLELERTDWFRVRMMGSKAEYVQRVTKGQRILVIGRMEIG
jgi:hypothetical protein